MSHALFLILSGKGYIRFWVFPYLGCSRVSSERKNCFIEFKLCRMILVAVGYNWKAQLFISIITTWKSVRPFQTYSQFKAILPFLHDIIILLAWFLEKWFSRRECTMSYAKHLYNQGLQVPKKRYKKYKTAILKYFYVHFNECCHAFFIS